MCICKQSFMCMVDFYLKELQKKKKNIIWPNAYVLSFVLMFY